MKRYVTEFVGTFFLVFTIGASVTHSPDFAPLAFGCALVALVYMGGHVSGAHYNPAVSIAFVLRGTFDGKDLLPYVVAQLLGAILASVAVLVVTGATFAPAPAPDAGPGAVLLAEALMTFALMFVILNVATHPTTEGNHYYGVAIGFTVLGGAYAVGNVSGAAFNPAVGTGPALVGSIVSDGSLADVWFYWVGPVVGAASSVPVFRMTLPADDGT